MKEKYISALADQRIIDYIKEKGFNPILVNHEGEGFVSDPLSCHPDMFMCRLSEDELFAFDCKLDKLNPGYRTEVGFNAVCTGNFFIHNLELSNPRLLNRAKELGLELINVRQGYTKCSTVVVDEKSIITYDKGIFKACEGELDALLINPGNVYLHGYDTGFIGGASGRLENEIIFNGDITKHPDYKRIAEFTEKKGFTIKFFADRKLTDIGSVI